MSIIRALWNAEICPGETIGPRDEQWERACKRLAHTEEQLQKLLTAQGRELLEQYDEDEMELSVLNSRDAFERGFRMGVQLLLDAMGKVELH